MGRVGVPQTSTARSRRAFAQGLVTFAVAAILYGALYVILTPVERLLSRTYS
jgi:hypothetical protein